MDGLRLRPATRDDARPVFAWRNDPWIVSLGSTRRTVSWEEHAAWFSRVLADPRVLLMICEDDAGTGLGTVRLDRVDDDRADVTVYLMREFTGRGLGVQALVQAASHGFARWPIRAIHALIREDNRASLSGFAKAGFRDVPPSLRCPGDHREMALTRHAQKIREHYVPLLHQHGPTFRAADWGSAQTQALRFRVLLEVGEWRDASILDVGCGVGHLYDELVARGFAGRYLGIDALGEMVAAARRRHPDASFEEGDILAGDARWTADYVLGAGLFTFGDEPLMRETIRAMFAACTKGVAFNALSARATRQEPGELYADPDATLAFCRTLAPSVTLRHDYLPHDFTIYMTRSGA